MKIAFLKEGQEVPSKADVDFIQSVDGKTLHKKVKSKFVKHEPVYEKQKVKKFKDDDDTEESTTEVEEVLVGHSFAREFPVLDYGFETGEPTMKGTFRDEDLTLKYTHKASSYGLEVVIL